MNKLLQRQMNRCISSPDDLPDEVRKLLLVVSDSYDHYEKDRKMLERSIDISSKELIDLNEQLKKETQEKTEVVYSRLRESLQMLSEEQHEITGGDSGYFFKLAQIAELLKQETGQRKAAELELRRREAHLLASQKIAVTGSWELNLLPTGEIGGKPLYWSDETYRILGYEGPGSVELTAELFYSKVHPDDFSRINQGFFRALETGSVFEMEYRIVAAEGTEKFVFGRAEIIKDAATGKPVRLIGTIQDITGIKNAERQLHQVNKELTTLFDNMQEAFFSVNMETYQTLQMTPACEDVYGYTKEEFFANSNLWYEVIIKEDRRIIDGHNAFMEAGFRFSQEYRIRDKQGQIRWLETKITPTLNSKGKVVRLDGVTSNITKRKEAEAALKDSEYKFRSLIENGADAIMILNENCEAIFVSNSLCRITGYSEEEILMVRSLDFIYGEDLPAMREHVAKVLANPGVLSALTYRRVKKDGSLIWCEGTAINLLHDPAVNGIVVNFRDITARVEYEEALKNSEHKFRSLIENSSDAVIVTNDRLERVFVSDSISRVTGFEPDEVLGKDSFSFAHPDDAGRTEAFMKEVLNNPGKPQTIIYRALKGDGSYMWCERVTINLLDDPAVKGLVSNLRDVTERVMQEQTLKASNEDLKKTNMELDKFVYSVSHDLRAPLASVLGLIEITRLDLSEEEVLCNLDYMKCSVNRLDGFISDILNYSKNARLEVINEKINFTDLLKELTEGLRFMNPNSKEVDIRMNIDCGNEFYSDRHRISVVLNNLLSNAYRYVNPDNPDPFINICVRIRKDRADILVEDNGIGIDKIHHAKIFEMFYRASNTSMGSGLGLYIVSETLSKLKGSIALESEPGKGTKFFLTIPNSVVPQNKNGQPACIEK